MELDDAARIDGASVVQLYLRIYVPLMAPALAAVGTYVFLFAWNDYFYQYMLLMSERNTTVAMALEQFFDDDDAPWNYMMGTNIQRSSGSTMSWRHSCSGAYLLSQSYLRNATAIVRCRGRFSVADGSFQA